MSIKEVAKNLGGVFSKNSPKILTGLSCAGVLTTTILAVKATPKAVRLIERREKEEGKLSKPDIIKTTWKCYIPAAVVGGITVGCIIGANAINTQRNAALAALYSISETAFREYQSKVVEEIGKNKETKIRDDVMADTIKNNPSTPGNIIFTGKGDVKCFDKFTGRYFTSDIEHIRQTAHELNRRLREEMWIPLNEFYYELNLEEVESGDIVGFDIDRGWIDIDYSSHLDHDNVPCLALSYKVYPRYCDK